MLNSNDTSVVLSRLANDLIKREKHEIVGEMNPNARVDFYNSVRTLNEVCDEIEKDVSISEDLVFLNTGS